MSISRRKLLKTVPVAAVAGGCRATAPVAGMPEAILDPTPFGAAYPQLDSQASGDWWQPGPETRRAGAAAGPSAVASIVDLNVPRDQVVAFALYTHQGGVLKLSAQLFPLFPSEPRTARLAIERGGVWQQIATAPVHYPGWSTHFRVAPWDALEATKYRVLHGEHAVFEGTIRHDPIEKPEIVVANLSCNSSLTKGARAEMVEALRHHDPDLLFFAGDQTYHHTQHTAGWLEFGLQFRDIMRDRPTVCIPDDHDVGHGNLWGHGGAHSQRRAGDDGGYIYPAAYVNMVQRAQSWHLPDPVDPAPVSQGIDVYFTRLHVGGVDFAIIEDRKFKTGPLGKIPQQGPRPDHITDERYDPRTIDLSGLHLLGERQMTFLRAWSQDWTFAEMKVVLSQTAFCGAVHLHGKPDNRLLADLDCNGWPQKGRNEALREIRRAWATHLCGDQHLAVTVKHGIDEDRDGPYGFTSPALVNTIYPRWWHPSDERPGPNPVKESPLPWTGDFRDGLGNRIFMMAYANPVDLADDRSRADGYGLVRFHKPTGRVTFECWPRFPTGAQFPGWPVTVQGDDNDGRRPVAWLPEIIIEGARRPVFQVIDEGSGEILYTVRARSNRFQPRVYSQGTFTLKVGKNRPDQEILTGLRAAGKDEAGSRTVTL